MKKLEREFYLTDGISLAKALIGKVLVHETEEGLTSGIIVETEAYMGADDAAAHSYKNKGKDGRTNIQYRLGGFAYIYLIYGMYNCVNVTANIEGKPEAVLIRALEPLSGLDVMARRRKTDKPAAFCSGPGKLCRALNITREQYGLDLCGNKLYIEDSEDKNFTVSSSRRVNIDYAGEAALYPWRFYIEGNKFVSKVPKTEGV